MNQELVDKIWKFRDKWMWFIAVKDRMKFLDDVYELVYGDAFTVEDEPKVVINSSDPRVAKYIKGKPPQEDEE